MVARGRSRDAIHEAATALFTRQGYAATSVRDIAEAASVDPALVIRHFGSKESLFLDVMELRWDERYGDVPIAELGPTFIRSLLESGDEVRGVFLALLRASDAGGVNVRLREVHDETFVAPLRARMSGADADLRARLAASLVGGLLYSLWVVGDDALAAADHADVVSRYGALLQALITPRD